MIDLSIIIVNFNGAGLLENCLSSIYKNTRKISFEIIFIDNNSSDHSVEIAEKRFSGIKIIRNKENRGFSRANNQGLEICQGRYALLLNTDTVVKEGAFDLMVEFMDANPKVGACGPRVLNADGTPQRQGGFFSRKFWLSKIPVRVDFVIGACLMVRREAIEKVGNLDENLFFSNDDLDWCLRIRKAGWQLYFLPQAEVIHHGGFTTRRFNRQLFVEGFRGGLYFSRKHYGNLIYQIYRALLVITLPFLIIISFLFDRKKTGAYLDILLLCFKGKT